MTLGVGAWMLSAWLAEAAVNIYVSPTGNDANPGSAAKPVASLVAAQKLERQSAGHEAVNVWLHGGTYYLPAATIFTPADSGTAKAPVIWQAVSGETPVISGGEKLDLSWQPVPNRAGVFQARVPAGLDIDQLFVNGQRQWMARYPNREPGEGFNVFDTWKLDHHTKDGPALDALAKDRIARWANPAGAYVHAMHRSLWGGVSWRVTGKNTDGTLALTGGTQNNRGSSMHPLYRYVENVFEELDAPGEWFYDRNAGTLYFYPPPGMDLTKATIEIVRLRHLIELQGSLAQPVKWLQFRGLTFRHAARTFMDTKEPLLRSDWTIYRGGAVFLTGTENCSIEDCTFDQVGGNAIFVNNYNRHATIRGCRIAEVGANGICFVGDSAAVRNALFNYGQRLQPADLDRTPGPKSDNYPGDCLVDDCLIYRSGRFEKQTAPVEIDMAQSITVRHCSIYDVPRAGINIGDGCWGGHVIEFCDIFDTVNETGDHGSFNAWGRDRYWQIKGLNLNDDAVWATNSDLPLLDAAKPTILRNNRWRCDHGWDIDLDDGASNYEIRNNLCLNGGIKNREGYHRVVENNVIAASSFHPHVWYKHSGDIFRRNIVAALQYFPAGNMPPPPWGAELDYNLAYVDGKPSVEPATKLAAQSGRDAHSIIGDAQFIDPAHGDFRVKESSSALKLGFTNFPMDQFGVQKPALKAIARTPSLVLTKKTPGAKKADSTTTWLGAKVKNLETLSEASVVGIGLDAGGALVLEVPADSPAAKLGLRKGDLLLKVDGKLIKNAGSLKKISKASGPIEVVREQQQQTLK